MSAGNGTLFDYSVFMTLGAERIATGRYETKAPWSNAAVKFAGAQAANQAMPIIFGDAQHDSAHLFKWALLDDLIVDASGTKVRFSRIQTLDARSGDLVKEQGGKRLSDKVRRGHSVVFTPALLRDGDTAAGGGRLQGSTMPLTEAVPEQTFVEGAVVQVTVNAHDRSARARKRCVEHYGATCIVCGFSFDAKYGDAAAGYIHVHHITPISTVLTESEIDPIRDLRPVCPNCHAVIHLGGRTRGTDEVVAMIAATASRSKRPGP